MEPIELIMKIWCIDESNREELERMLNDTPPKHLGLALLNLGTDDEAFAECNDAWMETYLPELRFA